MLRSAIKMFSHCKNYSSNNNKQNQDAFMPHSEKNVSLQKSVLDASVHCNRTEIIDDNDSCIYHDLHIPTVNSLPLSDYSNTKKWNKGQKLKYVPLEDALDDSSNDPSKENVRIPTSHEKTRLQSYNDLHHRNKSTLQEVQHDLRSWEVKKEFIPTLDDQIDQEDANNCNHESSDDTKTTTSDPNKDCKDACSGEVSFVSFLSPRNNISSFEFLKKSPSLLLEKDRGCLHFSDEKRYQAIEKPTKCLENQMTVDKKAKSKKSRTDKGENDLRDNPLGGTENASKIMDSMKGKKSRLVRSKESMLQTVNIKTRRSRRSVRCTFNRKSTCSKRMSNDDKTCNIYERGAHQAATSYVTKNSCTPPAVQKKDSPGHICRQNSKNSNLESMDENHVDKPTSCFIFGKKVTMIDDVKKVFVIDLLSSETCNSIRTCVDYHVQKVIQSGTNAPTWRTLYTYTKMDLPCGEVEGMSTTYTNKIIHDIARVIGEVYGEKRQAANLRARSWKEPHFLHYQKVENKPEHTGVQMHYDGCDLTFILALSDTSECVGGGTYFRCLRKTVKLKQGQAVIFPGELYHKGVDILSGVRTLIVCFLDGFDPKIYDDSKDDEDVEKYERENVIIC